MVRTLTAGAVVAAALALLAPAAAQACGSEQAHARANLPAGGTGRAPLIVGDSTMIYATPSLGARGVEADARTCRQWSEGVQLLAARARAGTLGHVAILALGANGPVSRGQISAALDVVGPSRVLGLVTPRNLGSTQGAMRAAAAAAPSRVLLIDWAGHSAGRGGWFAPDGLHPTPTGAVAFAKYVRARVEDVAFPPVGRLAVPARAAGTTRCGEVTRGGRTQRVFLLRGADVMPCERALELARRPPLRPDEGWRFYDWRGADTVWSWVLARDDREVLVGVTSCRESELRGPLPGASPPVEPPDDWPVPGDALRHRAAPRTAIHPGTCTRSSDSRH